MNSERDNRQRTADAVLQEQLTELENLYQDAPIGLCLLDRDLCYVRINNWLAAYNGAPVIEHIGRSVFDVVPDVALHIEPDLRSVLDTGEAIMNRELVGRSLSAPAAVPVTMLVSYYPLRTDDDFIAGVSIIAQDITALKKVEKHLLSEKQLSDTFVDSMPGLFFMLDENSKLRRWNQYAEKVMGYAPADLKDRPALDLISPGDRPRVAAAIERAFAEGQASVEFSLLKADGGEISSLGRGVRFDFDGSGYLCGLVVDISDRKRAEREIDERYRFESMMANISARFVHLVPENTDQAVQEGLREIAEFLGADRCALASVDPKRGELIILYSHIEPGSPKLPRNVNLAEAVPDLYGQLVRGETIRLGSLHDVSAVVRAQLLPFVSEGVKSLLAIPLMRGDEVRGVLGVDTLKAGRAWPATAIQRLEILGELILNAIERTQTELELRRRFEFETFLAELSARFVNLPAGEIDAEINRALRDICELLDFDQAMLIQYSEDLADAYPTHLYHRPGTPAMEPINMARQFPVISGMALAGEAVRFKMIPEPSPALRAEEAFFEEMGIKSALAIPVQVASSVQAVLGFSDMHRHLDWPENLVRQLRLVGEIFANALARKEAAQKLNDRYLFESLLSEMSTSFVKSMPKSIDAEIEKWLQRIAETQDLDRVLLTRYSSAHPRLYVSHSYTAPGIAGVQKYYGKGQWDYFTRKMMDGDIVMISRLEDLPEEAGPEREYWQNSDVQSVLMIPLRVGEATLGSLALSSHKRRISWDEDRVQRFQLIGGILSNVLERQESDARLLERYRLESLVSDLSSRFVNLPVHQVDEEVERGLQAVVEFFNVDRITLAQLSADRSSYQVSHSYAIPPMQPAPRGFDLNERIPRLAKRLQDGEIVLIDDLQEYFAEASLEGRFFREVGLTSILNVPLEVEGKHLGGLFIGTRRKARNWTDAYVQRLRLIGELLANVLTRRRSEEVLAAAFSEIKDLKEKLEAECFYLREEINLEHSHSDIIGQSKAIRGLITQIGQVAPIETTVLILGETGTGKELMARAIHRSSGRSTKPLVKVNCAALPGDLIESELFGHEKGAFTGAHARQVGRFEIAHGATIFLDEIGEIPIKLQSKLLRVLQDGEFEPLGSPKTVKVDARIIAATNRDLKAEVGAGRFREDLWYRLNVYPITVPPLRDRREDIPLLVQYLVARFGKKMGKTITEIPQGVMEMLRAYSWPGNIRELENVIERAVINTDGPQLRLADRLENGDVKSAPPGATQSLEEVERSHITAVLVQCHWKIEGREGAAAVLGLNPSTLRGRMRKLGVKRP